MKKISAVVVAVLFTAVLAFAASPATGDAKIRIVAPVTLNGTLLEPGEYSLKWTADGDVANVVVKRGKQEVSTTARLYELRVRPGATAIVRDANTNAIMEVRFRGKTTAISFEK